jgi:hypothetical protein
MEIVSQGIVYILVMVVSSLIGWVAFRRLHVWLRKRAKVEVEIRHLRDEAVRRDLARFLERNKVVGDADIRQGFVFAPVPPEKLEPLAVALGNAVSILRTLPNLSADVLYVKKKDGSLSMIDLDLDHLIDAARVMQRVAEDHRKSRSLYKGITDDEIKAMVRAGLSQWLKDDGEFGDSNAVMQGLWDERPEFLMAMRVVELLYKVKGASNG